MAACGFPPALYPEHQSLKYNRLFVSMGENLLEMNTPETHSDQSRDIGVNKARILNRVIAKAVDFIIVGTLHEAIPKIGFFAGLAYLLIADGLFVGRSVGKRLIGLKVVLVETDKACSVRESVIRNLIFVIGYILMKIPLIGPIFAVIILAFETLLMIGNEEGMRFGDEIAKTRVVEENPTTLNSQS